MKGPNMWQKENCGRTKHITTSRRGRAESVSHKSKNMEVHFGTSCLATNA